MLLLVTSGLLLRGLVRSQTTNPGFETRKVFYVGYQRPIDPAQAIALHRKSASMWRIYRGRNLTLANFVPLTGTWTPRIRVEDSHAPSNSLPGDTLANRVSSTYLDTVGIPILRGRTRRGTAPGCNRWRPRTGAWRSDTETFATVRRCARETRWELPQLR